MNPIRGIRVLTLTMLLLARPLLAQELLPDPVPEPLAAAGSSFANSVDQQPAEKPAEAPEAQARESGSDGPEVPTGAGLLAASMSGAPGSPVAGPTGTTPDARSTIAPTPTMAPDPTPVRPGGGGTGAPTGGAERAGPVGAERAGVADGADGAGAADGAGNGTGALTREQVQQQLRDMRLEDPNLKAAFQDLAEAEGAAEDALEKFGGKLRRGPAGEDPSEEEIERFDMRGALLGDLQKDHETQRKIMEARDRKDPDADQMTKDWKASRADLDARLERYGGKNNPDLDGVFDAIRFKQNKYDAYQAAARSYRTNRDNAQAYLETLPAKE